MSTVTVRECLVSILGPEWELKYPSLHWSTLTARALVKTWSEVRDLTPTEKAFSAWYDGYYGSMEQGMVEAVTDGLHGGENA